LERFSGASAPNQLTLFDLRPYKVEEKLKRPRRGKYGPWDLLDVLRKYDRGLGCFPFMKTLAGVMHVCVRTIQRWVEALVSAGCVRISKTKYGSNVYILLKNPVDSAVEKTRRLTGVMSTLKEVESTSIQKRTDAPPPKPSTAPERKPAHCEVRTSYGKAMQTYLGSYCILPSNGHGEKIVDIAMKSGLEPRQAAEVLVKLVRQRRFDDASPVYFQAAYRGELLNFGNWRRRA
jgi:hypothetical protein